MSSCTQNFFLIKAIFAQECRRNDAYNPSVAIPAANNQRETYEHMRITINGKARKCCK